MSGNLGASVAAHALNALPSDESALVEVAIGVDDDLRSEYDSYRRVAAELVEGFSDVVPAASPQLWRRIELAADLATPRTWHRPMRGRRVGDRADTTSLPSSWGFPHSPSE
jgi:hypothetical protein